MAESNKKLTQEERDQQLFDPNNMMVNMGGKLVPFSKINKPHHVVIQPKDHQPQFNAESFPDVEPEAKEREAKLAAARNQ